MSRIDLIVLLRIPDKEIPVIPRIVARNAVRLKPVSCRNLDRVDKGCCSLPSMLLLPSENVVEL